jgi:hypothetical protein
VYISSYDKCNELAIHFHLQIVSFLYAMKNCLVIEDLGLREPEPISRLNPDQPWNGACNFVVFSGVERQD